MKSLDYKLLDALSIIMEVQSFEIAANKLFISQSAISQRIKLLEENIGEPLLIRRHPITLTATGAKLVSHHKKINQLERELIEDITNEAPTKPVKVSIAVNADSIATWFIKAIAPILKNYLIELDLITEHEDRTLQKLQTGEAIGAVSSVKTPLKGYQSELLGQIRYCLVCSPEFKVKYFNNGVNSQTLKMAPAISFDHKDDMHVQYIAKHFHLKAHEYYCHTVRSSEAFVELALQGGAYCLLPQLQIESALKQGKLVELCANKELIKPMYWHSWVLVTGMNKKISNEIISTGRRLLS
ncbi:MAG: LysR family transcriptional regulator ArgP [Colwellia sp.]